MKNSCKKWPFMTTAWGRIIRIFNEPVHGINHVSSFYHPVSGK